MGSRRDGVYQLVQIIVAADSFKALSTLQSAADGHNIDILATAVDLKCCLINLFVALV